MNAKQLYHWDLEPAAAWCCSVCGNTFRAEYDANLCCACSICDQELGSAPHFQFYHQECWRTREAENEAKRIEKAEVVTDYEGPLYVEGCSSHNNGYFSDMSELLDWLDDGSDDEEFVRPEWAYCCDITGCELDAESILEQATDELHEDAIDCLPYDAVKDLEAAVDRFNAAVKSSNFQSWMQDTDRKVAIPPAEVPATK